METTTHLIQSYHFHCDGDMQEHEDTEMQMLSDIGMPPRTHTADAHMLIYRHVVLSSYKAPHATETFNL